MFALLILEFHGLPNVIIPSPSTISISNSVQQMDTNGCLHEE